MSLGRLFLTGTSQAQRACAVGNGNRIINRESPDQAPGASGCQSAIHSFTLQWCHRNDSAPVIGTFKQCSRHCRAGIAARASTRDDSGAGRSMPTSSRLADFDASCAKRVVADKFGGPEVLCVEPQGVPTPGDFQVVIRVAAAGVNPADTYIREGNYRFLPAEMPFTPGIEGSGQICSVGAKVTGLAKGDRCVVFGHHGQQSGSHATFCTADASVCFRIPDAIDLQTAAAATVAYCTAYRALRQQVSPIKPGQSLLVHGASGAVGLAAVQIARAMGVTTVFGTYGSAEGRREVMASGATKAFDHNDEDHTQDIMAETRGGGVDVILEMLSNVNLGQDLKLLAARGRVAVIGSRGPVDVDPRDLMLCEGLVHGVYLWSTSRAEMEEALDFIWDGILQDKLQPRIGATYTLDKAQEAHREVIERSARKPGKCLLLVEDIQSNNSHSE